MDMMCPLMDCGMIDWFLPCEWDDRYIPLQTMMNGLECPGCAACHDYANYKSLINTTIQRMQELFEKTVIMQNFLDGNSNALKHVEDLRAVVNIDDAFRDVLRRDVDALNEYYALDSGQVLSMLQDKAEKLDALLMGSTGDTMADVLSDYSQVQVIRNDTAVVNTDVTTAELLQLLRERLDSLRANHVMIQNTISQLEPPLLTYQQLPNASYAILEEDDRMSLRVAFKLLEKSRDGVRSLLQMNMDEPASAIQGAVNEIYQLLISYWEQPEEIEISKDTRPTTQNDESAYVKDDTYTDGEETTSNVVDGSGDVDGSGSEHQIIVMTGEAPKQQENNMFFQWLSHRYSKLN